MPFHIENQVLADNQVPNGGLAAMKAQLYLRALQGKLKSLMDGRAYVIQVGDVKPRQVKEGGQVIEGLRDYQLTIHYWLADPSQAQANDVVHGMMLRRDPDIGEDGPIYSTYQGHVFHQHPEGWQLATSR